MLNLLSSQDIKEYRINRILIAIAIITTLMFLRYKTTLKFKYYVYDIGSLNMPFQLSGVGQSKIKTLQNSRLDYRFLQGLPSASIKRSPGMQNSKITSLYIYIICIENPIKL